MALVSNPSCLATIGGQEEPFNSAPLELTVISKRQELKGMWLLNGGYVAILTT
jgi:hypothetical protein